MMTSTYGRREFLRRGLGLGIGAAALGGGLVPLPCLAGSQAAREQQTRPLMGTLATITVVTPETDKARYAMHCAFAEMERLIGIFDRHNPASALGVLNARGSLASPPPDLVRVLLAGIRLGKSTGYAFNPAIAPVVDLFDAQRVAGTLPRFDDHALAEALDLAAPGSISLDAHSVRLERGGMKLTLDGIAKGYITDAASRVLSEQGFGNHMVNAGGDIRVRGRAEDDKPWKIGIQHPERRDSLLTAVAVTGGGIATSGNYERPYDASGLRHHIISHITGKSADISSVTVKARDAAQADALATALALMPPGQALRYVEKYTAASCLIVDRQGRRYASSAWGKA